jgi:diguanylate cyclase (GGDEF)-like protein
MTGVKESYKDIDLLEECTAEESGRFLKLCRPICMEENNDLDIRGETGATLYIVWKGIIGSFSFQPDGSKRDIARYSRGKFFGETSLFKDADDSIHCYAVTKAELLAMDSKDFYDFIETYPETGIKICKAMSRHVTKWLFEASNFLSTMVMWGETARRRAITDELTGLYNQRFFSESIDIQVSKYRPKDGRFSLLMIDLDNIHTMNEFYGFRIADEYLRNVGQICLSAFRETAIISRLGGDEFAVLIPDTSAREAVQEAENMRQLLHEQSVMWKKVHSPGGEKFTASIGIAEFPMHGDSAETLTNAADEALRNAKKLGKDRVCVCNPLAKPSA